MSYHSLSYALFTGSNNWTHRIKAPVTSSQSLNIRICINSSLFSLSQHPLVGSWGQCRKSSGSTEWVLNKTGAKRELLDTVRARKLAYYGCLEKEIMQRTELCTQARKTTHGLDGQHQYLDGTIRGRVNQNDRGQKYMKKVRPWCGQPLDRGRLKKRNRTAGQMTLVTSGLAACTPRSAHGPTLGNEYEKPIPLLLNSHCWWSDYSGSQMLKVKVKAGRRGSEGIHVNTVALKSIFYLF